MLKVHHNNNVIFSIFYLNFTTVSSHEDKKQGIAEWKCILTFFLVS